MSLDVDKSIQGLGLTLPDIARESRVELTGTLDRVGMTNIEIPICLSESKGGVQTYFRLPARANAFVSLDDPQAKGIHMSRLFLQLQDELSQNPLSFSLMEKILNQFVETHRGLSESSSLSISFEHMIERPALKSANKGWRSYPITLDAVLEKGKVIFDLNFTVTYSSTCPCSAALARKLIQDHFAREFSQENISRKDVYNWLGTSEGVIATPHSQRSLAEVKIRFKKANYIAQPEDWVRLIDLVENRLGTPVQAAVKREDEQEFALLNGQNLMFCEDAARKIKNSLNEQDFIEDFRFCVSHLESLHPHNAVSIVTKGVNQGLKP